MKIELHSTELLLLAGALRRDLDDYNASPSDFPDSQYDAPAARRLLVKIEQECVVPF